MKPCPHCNQISSENGPYRSSSVRIPPKVKAKKMKALFARIKSTQIPNPIKSLGNFLSNVLKTILGTAFVVAGIAAIVAAGWVVFVGVHRVGMYLGINVYHWWTPQSTLEALGPIPWLVCVGTIAIPAIILFMGHAVGGGIADDIKKWIKKQ